MVKETIIFVSIFSLLGAGCRSGKSSQESSGSSPSPQGEKGVAIQPDTIPPDTIPPDTSIVVPIGLEDPEAFRKAKEKAREDGEAPKEDTLEEGDRPQEQEDLPPEGE
ncbi:hypothetical protein IIA15_08095 [candidate division TA06 bacterium]|nr:hypothetical protein [candidate division TA06 bacterium]